MNIVLKELGSSDSTNRRNAAFCVGELCKNGGNSALRYPSICLMHNYFDCCRTRILPIHSEEFSHTSSLSIYNVAIGVAMVTV